MAPLDEPSAASGTRALTASAGILDGAARGRDARSTRAASAARLRAWAATRPELLVLLAAAAVLYLWALDRNGLANDYYAAAVRSMSTNWHAFLYGSFDVKGIMTVDKPPLALWVQALSVRAFGFGSWSILVPQALMGVATVGLAYDLVRRRFGRAAGTAAGLALVLTPISVAIARHNNPDALLILCVTGALWCAVRALEDGRTRWLVLCGVCVGLGFETKMGAALLVVPGVVAAWLWVAPRGRRAALRALAAGGGALLVVGGAWPLLVALTPAADRPWISGTSDNSIWSLIVGYNGLGRLAGQSGGPQAIGGGGGGGGGQGSLFGGPTGPLRLVEASLGGQAGWLIGVAIVAIGGLLVATRLRRGDPATGWLIAVGGAFVTTAVAFSYAGGIFHPYYVSELAPLTAVLVGAGVGLALRRGRAARILGAAAVIAGAASELLVAHDVTGTPSWAGAVVVAVAFPGALVLALPAIGRRTRHVALGVALAALLAAPGAWAVQTLGHATNGTFPSGGPAVAGGPGGGPGGPGGGGPGGGGPGGRPGAAGRGAARAGSRRPAFGPGGPAGGTATGAPGARGAAGGGTATRGVPGGGGPGGASSAGQAQAVAYARSHGGGTVVTSSQNGTSAQVISGADIAAIGGFSGRESQVTAQWLAAAIRDGRIRWVLADQSGGGGLPGDTRVGSRSAMTLVAQTCTSVRLPSSSSSASSGSTAAGSGSVAAGSSSPTLYDCQGRADALLAAATAG